MRITHVVENLNRGGLERMVLELVKQQHRQGHQCQIVCVFEAGSLAGEMVDLGVPVIACGKGPGLDIRALARIRRSVRAQGSEILHTHNVVAHYYAMLATVGIRLRRVINTRHGMGESQRSRRREWLYRLALARTDSVVLVCEAARRAAVRRGLVPEGKTRVVPNGIRLDEGDSRTSDALRSLLGLAASTRIIGTVGRLNWAKDQASLIRAFRVVHDQFPDTALVLIGGGELRDALQQCADAEGLANSVYFPGDRNDVPALLQGMDLFALSSISEGYSMALLEACAAALPIVATDVGGNGEIVRDGLTGTLVPARDPPALAGALAALLREPAQAQTLGHAARAWVEGHGSLESMAASYAEIYGGPTA
ncbi:MAG TPA: glycosyltransferase [Rhodanobacter sp.]|nr:glycosyltransferase [Rhodanobacter sp.]